MNPPFLTTEPGSDPVITSAEFVASPERLCLAWTNENEICGWFGGGSDRVVNASIDLRVGGAWRFAFNEEPGQLNVLRGKYVEVVPNRRLVFTWIHEKSNANGSIEATAPSQVTVEIEQIVTGSRMVIRHEGIVTKSGRLGVSEGWSYGLLSLRELVEGERAIHLTSTL